MAKRTKKIVWLQKLFLNNLRMWHILACIYTFSDLSRNILYTYFRSDITKQLFPPAPAEYFVAIFVQVLKLNEVYYGCSYNEWIRPFKIARDFSTTLYEIIFIAKCCLAATCSLCLLRKSLSYNGSVNFRKSSSYYTFARKIQTAEL